MRMWHSGAALAVALLGAVAFTNGAHTNPTDTAPIQGRVMDLAGLALQQAHVRVTDETTGASTETLTEMNGRFWIPNLAPAHTYAVDVRCIGFVPWHAAGIHPTSTGAALADVAMEAIPALQHATERVAQR
jgi:Carboxypeptidase regulatory-like domain